jgi:hypothetical protein
MMLEDALKALSDADAPPARDNGFEIAALARMERRRFHRSLMRGGLLTVAAILALALVMPGLALVWQAIADASGPIAPHGVQMQLAQGIALTVASLALLPWWRRVI